MAGVNRMAWRRFFLYNAADGLLWSGIYAVGFYYAGNTLNRFRGPVDVALGGAAAVAVVVLLVWARRHAKRLEEEAERAYRARAGLPAGPAPAHVSREPVVRSGENGCSACGWTHEASGACPFVSCARAVVGRMFVHARVSYAAAGRASAARSAAAASSESSAATYDANANTRISGSA
jgi:hypothetical protein